STIKVLGFGCWVLGCLLPTPSTQHPKPLAEHRLPLRVVGAEVFDGAVALVEGSVEVVGRAFQLGGGGLEAVGGRRLLGQLARELFESLDLLDESEVEAVDGVELRLLYLDRVEEARVAVRSKAHAVL